MKIVGRVSFDQIIGEWALHECRGRLRKELSPTMQAVIDGPNGTELAVKIIRQKRFNVINSMLQASPTDYVRIEVSHADLPNIRVMGGIFLTEYTKTLPGDSVWV